MVIIAPQALQDLLDELEGSRAWVFLTKTAKGQFVSKPRAWVGLILDAGGPFCPDPIHDSA
jgi:hypothetical protein